MGLVRLYLAGGLAIVADKDTALALPQEMTDAIGQPRVVDSGESIIKTVRES